MHWVDIQEQNFGFSPKNTAKKYEKKFFLVHQGLNQGPRGYETCMLPKSHGDLLLQGRIFYGS